MGTLREAVVSLIAAIDQATKDKWKKHKGQNLFQETAEKLVTEALGGQVPAEAEELAGQAATAGAKLLMGSFDLAYETAVDTIGQWLEETAGEPSKAILDRVLLMDVIDRVAYAVALKTILEAVDKEAWQEKGSTTWNKVAKLFRQLAKDFFEKGLSKKALKKLKKQKVSADDWAKKLQESVVGAAAPVQKTNIPQVLKNFSVYAKQIQEALKEEDSEEKAASVRFASLNPSTYQSYLDSIPTDCTKVLLAVPPKHWQAFAHTVLAGGFASTRLDAEVAPTLLTVASNIDNLLGPDPQGYFTSPVDLVDGFGVSLAMADKLFKEVVMKKQEKKAEPKPKQKKATLEADYLLLQNAIKQLGKAKGKEDMALQLQDLIDAADGLLEKLTGMGKAASTEKLAANIMQRLKELQEKLESGEIDPATFESFMEELEAQSKHAEAEPEPATQEPAPAPTEKAATKSKLAKLVKAGYAPPKVVNGEGEVLIPDLRDATTRKAFIRMLKTGKVSKPDLALVLSNKTNRTIFENLVGKKKQAMEPTKEPPWAKQWQDTSDDALQFARENIMGFDTAKNVSVIPDPQVEYVWMVFNHDRREAYIVYLKENDFEDVFYEDALKHEQTHQRGW